MIKHCGLQIAECGTENSNKPFNTTCSHFNPKSALRNPNSKGFTLIEIIVLIVIAGILLPAIVVPFVSSVKGSGKPEMATTAMYLGHQKMEEFMKYDYSNVPHITPPTAYAPADISTYYWQWEIIYVNNNFNSSEPNDLGYKRIMVRVKDPESDTYEIYSVVTNFP